MLTQPISAVGAANAQAVATVRGRPGMRTCIGSVIVSYSAAPAGGRLTIVGQTSDWMYDIDLSAAGPTIVPTQPFGIYFDVGEDVVLTLFPAGAAVVGKVNCVATWESVAR